MFVLLFVAGIILSRSVEASKPAPAQYFDDQILDHLANPDSRRRWTQRFYTWNEHFAGPGHPILVVLGGEGAIEPETGIFYPFITDCLARDLGAFVLEPEHRFYGRSQPITRQEIQDTIFQGKEDPRVKLFTSEQALYDAMRLIRYTQETVLGCATDPQSSNYCPVITVGGSYPGFLSAMARLRFPSMVDMAYAASAPMTFYSQQIDSTAYYDHITQVADGALPGCADAVRQTLLDFEKWVKQESVSQPMDPAWIGACPGTLPSYVRSTIILLEETIMMVGYTFANDNMAYYPPSNHTRLYQACQRFLDSNKSPQERLQTFLIQSLRGSSEETCFDMYAQLPSGDHATISSGDWSGVGTGDAGESWDFQTCTLLVEAIAFGPASMFPNRPWTEDWLRRHCQIRFGVQPRPTELVQAWEFDNLVQAGASRILFTNGLKDGWSVGAIKSNLSDSLLALNFPNGAHHSDLSGRGPSEDDTEDIQEGFRQIHTILSGWLAELPSYQAKMKQESL